MSVISEKTADIELGEETDKDSRNKSQLGGGSVSVSSPHFTLTILATSDKS
jgi:hypothetical protein